MSLLRALFSDCSSAASPGNVAHNNDVKLFGSSFFERVLSNPLCNSQTLKMSLLPRIAGSQAFQIVAIKGIVFICDLMLLCHLELNRFRSYWS